MTGLLAIPSPSQAATAGSYTNTYTGTSPDLYYPRYWSSGPIWKPPTTVPSTAKITGITGTLSFTTQPVGTNYQAWICRDLAAQYCQEVSPTGSFFGSNTWNFSVPAYFNGLSAKTTNFYFRVRIDDGGSTAPGSIIPALNPVRYSKKQQTTVSYTY